MTDQIITQVLTGLAQQQRDFHAANQDVQKRTMELAEEIRDDVAEMKTDYALVKRDVDDLKEWRRMHVDPALGQFRDGVSQAKGGLKGLRLAIALGATGAGGGLIAKIWPAIAAAFR